MDLHAALNYPLDRYSAISHSGTYLACTLVVGLTCCSNNSKIKCFHFLFALILPFQLAFTLRQLSDQTLSQHSLLPWLHLPFFFLQLYGGMLTLQIHHIPFELQSREFHYNGSQPGKWAQQTIFIDPYRESVFEVVRGKLNVLTPVPLLLHPSTLSVIGSPSVAG